MFENGDVDTKPEKFDTYESGTDKSDLESSDAEDTVPILLYPASRGSQPKDNVYRKEDIKDPQDKVFPCLQTDIFEQSASNELEAEINEGEQSAFDELGAVTGETPQSAPEEPDAKNHNTEKPIPEFIEDETHIPSQPNVSNTH